MWCWHTTPADVLTEITYTKEETVKTRSTVPGSGKLAVRWATLVATLALAVGTMVAPASPASADSGDGLLVCNEGEICFRNNDLGANVLRKHFFWDANHHVTASHGAYKWFNADGGFQTTRNVMDDADQLRNRDTACSVRVWDVDGKGNWFWYASQGRLSSSWLTVIEKNNGHSRCESPAPITR